MASSKSGRGKVRFILVILKVIIKDRPDHREGRGRASSGSKGIIDICYIFSTILIQD
jgi:hypothetical protein